MIAARRTVALSTVVAATALGLSFAPWLATEDAWHASTLWTLAVAASAASAAAGLLAVAFRSGRRASVACAAGGAALAVGGCLFWLRQWWLVEHPPPGRSGWWTFSGLTVGDRSHPVAVSVDLVRAGAAGPTWISYVAGALLLAGATAALRLVSELAARPASGA